MKSLIRKIAFLYLCIEILNFNSIKAGHHGHHGHHGDEYKNPHYSKDRTTMVHLFEWKYKDIARECEQFLGPMGYGGVQVSPINENLVIKGRPWYERYQPISYKIATRSGNEKQFRDMVHRCNKVGVRIYVDAVINHMTGDVSNAVGTGGSRADPKNARYPAVPYGPEDFNQPRCSIDYSNATSIRDCEMVGMHDLDQSRENVRNKIVEFFNRVIDHGIAGFRIDAAKHMWPENLKIIYSRIKDLNKDIYGPKQRPFIYQEVISFFNEPANKFQYNNIASVIDFVFGSTLGLVFRGKKPLDTLRNWGTMNNGLLPSKDAVVMIENHDNQRGHGAGGASIITYKEPKIYKMAVAFMLAHPYGHPRVMSSFEFSDPNTAPPMDKKENIISPHPLKNIKNYINEVDKCGHGWVCEHRWRQIFHMVQFRNIVQDSKIQNWWSNGNNQIAFSRGNRGFIAFNGENNQDLKHHLNTGMQAGKYCDIISGRKMDGKCTGKTIIVHENGTADIEIMKSASDGCIAIHAESKL